MHLKLARPLQNELGALLHQEFRAVDMTLKYRKPQSKVAFSISHTKVSKSYFK